MSDTEGEVARGLTVGIVSDSIAGCTTAIELLRLGCEVTLFERIGEKLKDRGADIGVSSSVMDTSDGDSRLVENGCNRHREVAYLRRHYPN